MPFSLSLEGRHQISVDVGGRANTMTNDGRSFTVESTNNGFVLKNPGSGNVEKSFSPSEQFRVSSSLTIIAFPSR